MERFDAGIIVTGARAQEICDLKVNLKFETYAQWKQYIWNKYHDFSDEKLEEFSRCLNQCSRNTKPVYECWKTFISIYLALMFNTPFEFLILILDFHFSSILEVVVVIGLP